MTGRFESADWYRACNLEERVAGLRSAPQAGTWNAKDLGAAQHELDLWKQQAPFDRGDWFARRLLQAGLQEAELLELLAEPIERVRERLTGRPIWLRDIELAFATPRPESGWELPLPGALQNTGTLAFLEWIEPLIRQGCVGLRLDLLDLKRRAPTAPFDPDTAQRLLAANLAWPLHTLVMRTLVLELNVARMQSQLEGSGPEARFLSFIARLRNPEIALDLLAEYPVLARRVVESIAAWRRASLEFLEHLSADWSDLRSTLLLGSDPGELVGVDGGAGDAHRGGRSVLVARFAKGQKVVYKPHPMGVDVHYQELLAWLNDHGSQLGMQEVFRTLTVLERGDHGWVEFVETAPCTSVDQARRFFWRQGAFVALLYALEATDFHFENLIAAGEHPVLVDLESLFHGRPPEPQSELPDSELVARAISQSVLRSGLLPSRSWVDGEYQGIDLSGLGGAAGQMSPDRVLQFEEVGTDAMRATRLRMAIPGSKNQPELGGTKLNPLEYREEIARGFVAAYRLLASMRADLLAAGGPIERFHADEVRSVLRATRAYGMLQFEALHPDFQRDGLELERFLNRLWVGVDESSYLLPALPYERRDLLAGDIPYFSSAPNSTAARASSGEEILGFWPQSGLDQVRQRIASLSEKDLLVQLWFVRASLSTLTLDDEKYQWPSYPPVGTVPLLGDSELRRALLVEAVRIGERLEATAFRAPGQVAWIGLAFSQQQWGLVPLLDDLYAGVTGVIHFLAYLGELSGQARFTLLARQALATFRKRLDHTRSTIRSVGGFNGLGGIIYAFSHWSALWEDSVLLKEAASTARRLGECIDEDEDLDLIGGCAGALLGLLALHARLPEPWLVELAKRCAERILQRAVPMEQGLGWFTRIQTDRPISGFSHGGSGIAFALLAMHRVCGEARYREAALAAIAHERTQFVPGAGNWLDSGNVDSAAHKALSVAWCYGAPGIGLARFAALATLDDANLRAEARAALKTTIEQGFGRNHSLCHGDLGNLDVLLAAQAVFDDSELRELTQRITCDVLASLRRDGVLCGIPLGTESPALMNGISGTGFGLLRLAYPDRVPSVLTLAAPWPKSKADSVENPQAALK